MNLLIHAILIFSLIFGFGLVVYISHTKPVRIFMNFILSSIKWIILISIIIIGLYLIGVAFALASTTTIIIILLFMMLIK